MARNFNGTTQGLVATSWNLPTTGKITCSAWVYLLTAGKVDWNAVTSWGQTVGGIFQWGTSSAGLGHNDLNIAVVQSSGAGTTAVTEGVQFPDNAWQHICFTADGSTLTLYRGGVSKGTPVSYDGTLKTSFTPIGVGAKPNNTGTAISPAFPFYFPGYIAHVSMWDEGLTAAEVSMLANGLSSLSVRPQSLLNYWPLTNRQSPEPDLINANNLTLISTPTIADNPSFRFSTSKQTVFNIPLSLSAPPANANENLVSTDVISSSIAASRGATPYTYSIFAGDTGGLFSINSSTGVLSKSATGSFDYDTTTSYNLTIRVTDNVAATADAAMTITVKKMVWGTATISSVPQQSVRVIVVDTDTNILIGNTTTDVNGDFELDVTTHTNLQVALNYDSGTVKYEGHDPYVT